MKTKMQKITKSILVFLMGILVFGTAMETYAAPSSIQLGDPETVPQYIGGVHFTTKTTTDGGYVYCLNIHKNTAKNVKANLKGQRDAGIAYILANGYPAKKITGSKMKDYYITQTAVWWYLDDTTGSSNLGEQFKKDGSDPQNLRPTVKSLVANAKKAKAQGYTDNTKLSINVKDSTMTLKDGYYVSSEIYANSYSNIDSYNVTLTNAPQGTIIVNSNGKQTSTIGVKEKFTVKVPASKISGTKLNIKVNASATGTITKAYEYIPTKDDMQNVAKLIEEKQNVSSSVNLDIATTKVTIVKVDKATGKALAGAKLVVKDSTGKVVTTWVTTTNGHVIQNLANGNYTVTEVEAPKGYKLNTEAVPFTVSNSNRDVQVKFANEAKQSVVNIIKIDKSTGDALAGAVLVVKDSTGKEIARFTSTTDPYTITGLADGTYTVEEISAPQGYMLNSEKMTFTIDDNNLSHQITFENYPEVVVPNTASASSILFTILGIAIIGTGIGFVYKNGKKA